jgi:formylglycine-generating enzyme required for sulfatase activity
MWEWCADWYGEYPTETVVDPLGPEDGHYRVLRGGSWCDYAQICRSAQRYGRVPAYRVNNRGFRCVLSR